MTPRGSRRSTSYLRERARRGRRSRSSTRSRDYDEYVDGKPRYDGVRSFLQSRGIQLPEGSPDDPPTAETICGIGNRKNELVLKLIREQGVEPYDGSVRYVQAVRDAGLRRAVVSSSANCRDVLIAAGIEDLFEARIDGVVAEREHLKGKPAPDTFLAGARALGVEPAQAASSRTRWRASRPAGPATSASWSASTASARPTRCASTARRSSSSDLAELLDSA